MISGECEGGTDRWWRIYGCWLVVSDWFGEGDDDDDDDKDEDDDDDQRANNHEVDDHREKDKNEIMMTNVRTYVFLFVAYIALLGQAQALSLTSGPGALLLQTLRIPLLKIFKRTTKTKHHRRLGRTPKESKRATASKTVSESSDPAPANTKFSRKARFLSQGYNSKHLAAPVCGVSPIP